MSRLIQRKIDVTTQDDVPWRLVDGENTYIVDCVIDQWIEAGNWLYNEPSRKVYRVQTTNFYLFDIEHVGEEWFIYRVWD